MTNQHASNQGLRIEILDGKNVLDTLKPAWTELCGRAAAHDCSQTFYWAVHAWAYAARRGGCRLRILVGRDRGRLVLVWPLVVRGHGPWRLADCLGSTSEYRDVLVEQNPASHEWIDAAWRVISAQLGVDLVRCVSIRADAAVSSLLKEHAAAAVWRSPTLFIPIERWPNWQIASQGMTAKSRRELRRCRRRLSDCGQVTIQVLDHQEEVERALAWLFAHKRAWARRKGVRIDWLPSEAYQTFLTGVAKDALRAGHLLFGVLKLDGKILAGLLSFVAGSRMELYMMSYDREWGSYGPGRMLLNEMINLAFERRLRAVDFRSGLESFKRDFMTDKTQMNNYMVSCSRWGACYTAWLRSPLRAAIKSGYQALPAAVRDAMRRRRQ